MSTQINKLLPEWAGESRSVVPAVSNSTSRGPISVVGSPCVWCGGPPGPSCGCPECGLPAIPSPPASPVRGGYWGRVDGGGSARAPGATVGATSTASGTTAAAPTGWKPKPLPTPRTGPNGHPRCETHTDARDWVEELHPKRPGFLRSVCRVCGVWIGDRSVAAREEDERRR